MFSYNSLHCIPSQATHWPSNPRHRFIDLKIDAQNIEVCLANKIACHMYTEHWTPSLPSIPTEAKQYQYGNIDSGLQWWGKVNLQIPDSYSCTVLRQQVVYNDREEKCLALNEIGYGANLFEALYKAATTILKPPQEWTVIWRAFGAHPVLDISWNSNFIGPMHTLCT